MRGLRALLTCLLFFCGQPSLAWPAHGAVAASYSGPGDVNSGATAWWGLRAYSAAQADGTHAAVNIRRASDTQTCDVLLTTSGDLGNTTACSGAANGTAFATFCAATTCTIVTWYDQPGAGANNFTQATVAKQDTLILSCLGAKACARRSAGQNYSATGSSIPVSFTLSLVANRTGATSSEGDIFIGGGANGFYFDPTPGMVSYFNAGGVTAPASDTAWHAMQLEVGSGSSNFYIDATANALAGLGFAFPSAWTFGDKSSTPTNGMTGDIVEMGIWPSGFNATQAGNICHNQFTYWGTSTSC